VHASDPRLVRSTRLPTGWGQPELPPAARRVGYLAVAGSGPAVVAAAKHAGAGAAKTVRSVLNGVMSYAIRAGAITSNRVRDVERIGTQRRRVARALSDTSAVAGSRPWRPTTWRCARTSPTSRRSCSRRRPPGPVDQDPTLRPGG
jgi:hypothetical protein